MQATGKDPTLVHRHLVAISDLSREELIAVLDRSEELRRLHPEAPPLPRRAVLGLFFFQPSTRTRLGFQAAAGRLGATTLELYAMRSEPEMSREEAPLDAFRSVAGYCDAIVLRHKDEEAFRQMLAVSPVPIINGGCGTSHHPTQSLLDLFYIRTRLGRLDGLRIGIAGDLAGSRSARSLVEALHHFEVSELRLMAPADRQVEPTALGDLERCTQFLKCLDPGDLDVLYMAGFPRGVGGKQVDRAERWKFRLTRKRAQQLPASALILCPLPRIDEIAEDVDDLPQATYFHQSQCGLFVRMALIEKWSEGPPRRGQSM